MLDTVKFQNPPIVELIFGVQFSPLSRITTAHLGWFWKELGQDWIDLSDGPAFSDHFERFDKPIQTKSAPSFDWRSSPFAAMNRIAIGHQKQDRLLQIQASQFRFHWRKSQGTYPSYESLIQEFEEMFSRYLSFIQLSKLGNVLLNQWDLTYVNAFPRGVGWNEPKDWAQILPGLFGVPPVADGLTLDSRSANWSYVINPDLGRIHIAAGSQILPDESDESLLLRLTARGPTRGDQAATRLPRQEFDQGHSVILKTFLQVTSPEVHTEWGRTS